MKYYTIQNGEIYIAESKESLEKYYNNVQNLPEDYESGKYTISEGILVLNTDWETEQAAKEQERISMLSLTSADVERAIYKVKGMDFEDVITMVEAAEASTIDIKALRIELKANNFYRGNPYIDAVGQILGFTKKQLDDFFETGDYTKLSEAVL